MTITLSPATAARPIGLRFHVDARIVLLSAVAPAAVGWLLYCCLTIGGAALR